MYIGSTTTTFKDRYRNYKTNFNNKQKRYSTELLNDLWEIKYKNTDYNLNWDMLCRTKTKPNSSNTCKLCSLERFEMEKLDKKISLNKR